MADSVITQAPRTVNASPDTPLKAGQHPSSSNAGKRSCLASIFCCLKGEDYDYVPPYKPPLPAAANNSAAPVASAAVPLPFSSTDPGYNLLPPRDKADEGRRCLVLDLDETLVHSSFTPVPNPDFVVPIEIEGQLHNVYVCKRPHVDDFLKAVGQIYEIVLFTASLSKYADPVADLLDIHRVFRHRLFRQHCVFHQGIYVKDLSRLGRPVRETIIVDNSPASYAFHPDHAVPVISWFDDPSDTQLVDLLPLFSALASSTALPSSMRISS